jgi:hypothetical protein
MSMLILQFVFKVLPIIVPFNFGEEELNLDESVSTMCSITKGDLPIQIWWTFIGDREEFSYNISSNEGMMITRNNQRVSMLSIEAVKASHKGNYTCFASNKGGVAHHSAYLAINGSLETVA